MSKNPTLEIPHELRTVAEQGVGQARAAFDGFLTAAHKAMDDASRQAGAVQESAREINRKTVSFAEANVAASFDFAERLAKAQTLEEWTRLQTAFVTEQAQRLSEQAKALGDPAGLSSGPLFDALKNMAKGIKPG